MIHRNAVEALTQMNYPLKAVEMRVEPSSKQKENLGR